MASFLCNLVALSISFQTISARNTVVAKKECLAWRYRLGFCSFANRPSNLKNNKRNNQNNQRSDKNNQQKNQNNHRNNQNNQRSDKNNQKSCRCLQDFFTFNATAQVVEGLGKPSRSDGCGNDPLVCVLLWCFSNCLALQK